MKGKLKRDENVSLKPSFNMSITHAIKEWGLQASLTNPIFDNQCKNAQLGKG